MNITKAGDRTMKWKELMKSKKLLSLLVAAVATLATIFVIYATRHTTTHPTSNGTSLSAFQAKTDGDGVMQGSDRTESKTFPADSSFPTRLAGRSDVVQGSGGTGSGTSFYDTSAPTRLTGSSDYDWTPTTNANLDEVAQGSDGTASGRPSDTYDSSTRTILAYNSYPDYDRDLQIYANTNALVQGAGSTGSGFPTTPHQPAPDEQPTSHLPEPATMLLLGSGLIGLAVLGRKVRKS